MQVFYLCIALALFNLKTAFTMTISIAEEESNDSESQGLASFINGLFKHKLNAAERHKLDSTTTIRITKTTTVNIICAKTVNITGCCRRRRGYWAEEPVVLTFDEATDKLTEILFTPVYSIETTELHRKTVNDRVARDGDTTVTDGQLASSMSSSADEYVLFPSRVYFQPLFNFVGNVISAFLPIQNPSSIITTESSQNTTDSTRNIYWHHRKKKKKKKKKKIFTTTREYWMTLTTVNTFFIQVCTPSPFPFPECFSFQRSSSQSSPSKHTSAEPTAHFKVNNISSAPVEL